MPILLFKHHGIKCTACGVRIVFHDSKIIVFLLVIVAVFPRTDIEFVVRPRRVVTSVFFHATVAVDEVLAAHLVLGRPRTHDSCIRGTQRCRHCDAVVFYQVVATVVDVERKLLTDVELIEYVLLGCRILHRNVAEMGHLATGD